ncbi:MAG: hypothetical protein K6F80_07445 [Oscillospiraceae bacterium]|nr:hypothetical protein [Oscillospiraceae bacterium]
MKTDVITIDSNLHGRCEALEEAERFAAYNGLTGKNATHLRLLTEETISMVHGILDDFRGDFWIECDNKRDGKLCRIYVAARTSVSELQEEELMEISSTGKNEEAKGILGTIREVFRWIVQRTETNPQNAVQPDDVWSLQQYRSGLQGAKDEAGRQAWDELEKSIVANLSDEIRIGITDERATVIIERFFSTVSSG